MKEKIGFIGLGVMGEWMARNLLTASFDLVVTTTRPQMAAVFRDLGATVVDTPADVARLCRVVCTCVPDHPALLQIIEGPQGICSEGWADGLWVDFSTIAPNQARATAAVLSAYGASFADAPISGGRKGAETATLTIMFGGDKADFTRVQPVLDAMGKVVRHVGPVGAGQTVKACNQLMMAVNLMGVCEAIGLARANGVDPRLMREMVQSGTGASKVLETIGLRYLDGLTAPGFRLELMRKDLGIVCAASNAASIAAPTAGLALDLLDQAVERGLGGLDSAGLGVLYEQLTKDVREQ